VRTIPKGALNVQKFNSVKAVLNNEDIVAQKDASYERLFTLHFLVKLSESPRSYLDIEKPPLKKW
jgi:hypothetical protein